MRDLPSGTVTLLFSDIEGSTHLLQQLGDRYRFLLRECRQLQRAAFHQWNGHEVDTQGDGFFVAFARATDAVSAAVAAQRANVSHLWSEGVVVHVRMGIHTGEPQLSSEGYVGLDVHHAARIMSAAYGGQVLLSQTTRDLVEHDLPDDVSLRDLGAHHLKDFQHKSHLFQLVIAALPADFPPLKTLDIHPNNLPIQPTSLIGREKEVFAVQHLLGREDIRLLTLTGPGGTGKTRLGLQVAAEVSDHFADGVFLVNLAPISDPALVVPSIAQTLGVKETGNQFLLDLLKANLRDKHLLLLLDNFEQVISASVQVADLLAACRKLKIVVTSRQVLHVQGEQEFAVPPLAVPNPKHLPDLIALSQYEAVALFIARAQAVKPEFQITNTNAPAVAEICARLDGLPLAIELAAARIKLLPPQALLARLGQRLEVLTSGARDAPARQQTLRNTIAWSYHLLDAEEQRLFRRLSVFVGGCTLEAAEAVCGALSDGKGVVSSLDDIASLIDKSLLKQTEQEDEEPRLLMLETVREYGLEVLAASGEMEDIQQAHANYYLNLVEEAEPDFGGPEEAKWLERLERELDNLRAALNCLFERGEKEKVLRLGVALRQFWVIRGHFSEGRAFLERALNESEGEATTTRAKALVAAAWFGWRQSDLDRAQERGEESLALYQQFGDQLGMASALELLGEVALMGNDIATARALFEESTALYTKMGDRQKALGPLMASASMMSLQGEYPRAHAVFEEILAKNRKLGSKRGIARALFRLAWLLILQGDTVTARPLIEEGLALFQQVGARQGIAVMLDLSSDIAFHEGDFNTAHSLIEESLRLYREIGSTIDVVEALPYLARITAFQGDLAAARALYEESLAFAREVRDQRTTAFAVEGLARVVASQGEPTWAARLWGAAEALRDTMGTPLPPVDRPIYEQSVAAARTLLGEQAFAAAWAEGRAMSPEQALAAKGQVVILTPASAELSSILPAKSRATYPAGLTAREVEVLRFIAKGLTDAEVAEQLVISPRTVNTHLTAIYGKIGVTSRSAATRYAIEQQLV